MVLASVKNSFAIRQFTTSPSSRVHVIKVCKHCLHLARSMRLPFRVLPKFRSRGSPAVRCFTLSALTPSGRTAPYRRIENEICGNLSTSSSGTPSQILPISQILVSSIRLNTPLIQQSRRGLCTTPRSHAISFRDLKSEDKPEGPLKQNSKTGADQEWQRSEAPEEDAAERAYRAAQQESEAARKKEQARNRSKQESRGSAKEEGGHKQEGEQKRKQDTPPPPPHGNKSPWQVFTDTLKTEFQASKEWNESTKQLSSSAHQFTQNESVKRARAAYSGAASAATSTTAQAIKGTGRALGQGAAWTWDTTVVKGVRSGVNATGRGIDKVTKPVRETKVYKTAVGGVKDVIDDGSSSRYGGWVEKEERRKQRELRELNELGQPGGRMRRAEKMEEDPEYAFKVPISYTRSTNLIPALAPMSHSTRTPNCASLGEISKIRTESCNQYFLFGQATTNRITLLSRLPEALQIA